MYRIINELLIRGDLFMNYDILIKNAICIDSSQKINEKMDVAIIGNRISEIAKNIDSNSALEINAEGCIVTPGLIDFHSHIYYGGTDIGISADSAYLPTGVTAVVDAGSAGSANFDAYMKGCVTNTLLRVKSFVNVCPTGLGTTKFHENIAARYFDIEKTKLIVEKYRSEIIALKIRASSDLLEGNGVETIKAAIKLAEELGLPLAIHTTNPPILAGELAEMLRAGDIYIHCYQGTGHNIIEQDVVSEKIQQARKRGVVFDAANGGNHWVFNVTEQAIRQGFYPDIISTDLTVKTLYREPVHSLPYIMSKYLMMGMELTDIIKSCTETPAKLMNMADEIGTMKVGAFADIAILKVVNKTIRFVDTNKEIRYGDRAIENQMTIKDGKIVYRSLNC